MDESEIVCEEMDCDAIGEVWEFHHGKFCSVECTRRAEGREVLQVLKNDHRICFTCFKQVKEISEPPEGQLRKRGVSRLSRQAYVGEQDPTEHAMSGSILTEPTEQGGGSGPVFISANAEGVTGCGCGNLNLREADEDLRRNEGGAVLVNLLRQLHRLYEDGEIDGRPSKARLFDTLRENGRDWPLAVGEAVYGG